MKPSSYRRLQSKSRRTVDCFAFARRTRRRRRHRYRGGSATVARVKRVRSELTLMAPHYDVTGGRRKSRRRRRRRRQVAARDECYFRWRPLKSRAGRAWECCDIWATRRLTRTQV